MKEKLESPKKHPHASERRSETPPLREGFFQNSDGRGPSPSQINNSLALKGKVDEEFSTLVAIAQLHLWQEYRKDDWLLTNEESYTSYKEFALKNKPLPASRPPPQPSKIPVPKKPPLVQKKPIEKKPETKPTPSQKIDLQPVSKANTLKFHPHASERRSETPPLKGGVFSKFGWEGSKPLPDK